MDYRQHPEEKLSSCGTYMLCYVVLFLELLHHRIHKSLVTYLGAELLQVANGRPHGRYTLSLHCILYMLLASEVLDLCIKRVGNGERSTRDCITCSPFASLRSTERYSSFARDSPDELLKVID